MPSREPETEAGRALLEELCGPGYDPYEVDRNSVLAGILAIEAELRRSLAEQVDQLARWKFAAGKSKPEDWVRYAEVRAALIEGIDPASPEPPCVADGSHSDDLSHAAELEHRTGRHAATGCVSCAEPSHDIDYHDHHWHSRDNTVYFGPSDAASPVAGSTTPPLDEERARTTGDPTDG